MWFVGCPGHYLLSVDLRMLRVDGGLCVGEASAINWIHSVSNPGEIANEGVEVSGRNSTATYGALPDTEGTSRVPRTGRKE